jgi:hypothetical protein
MGKPKRKPLDRRTDEGLLALFESRPEWKPTEVPWKEIARLGLARPNETISVWASGSSNNPLFMHSIEDIIAGMDVLTHETNPNLAKNEPPGNAYHYVIQKNSKTPSTHICCMVPLMTGQ